MTAKQYEDIAEDLAKEYNTDGKNWEAVQSIIRSNK